MKIKIFMLLIYFSFFPFGLTSLMNLVVNQILGWRRQSSLPHGKKHKLIFYSYLKLQKVPKWWIWYYWICPLAWMVYRLIAYQYGDVEDTIEVPGMSSHPMIKDYIKKHFGYDSELWLCSYSNGGFCGLICFHVLLLHQEIKLPN